MFSQFCIIDRVLSPFPRCPLFVLQSSTVRISVLSQPIVQQSLPEGVPNPVDPTPVFPGLASKPNKHILEPFLSLSYARILKAHSYSYSMSGGSIWASLECQCCFWTAGGRVVTEYGMTLALQLFKNCISTQEKLRLNLHSLSVSELLEYGR
jgi:hypothetical protein